MRQIIETFPEIPQFLRDEGYTKNNKMVAITQPRRVAAMTIGTYLALHYAS